MYTLPIGTLRHIARARGLPVVGVGKTSLAASITQAGGQAIMYQDKNEWLSTGDINRVMRTMAGVEYLGTYPDDFPEYTNLLDRSYPRGKIYAAVFNTDNSSGPGKHWVAVGVSDDAVCFFDSVGDPPSKNVRKFINHTSRPVYINRMRHQVSNTECGVFALHFIKEFASGKTCSAHFSTVLGDVYMKDHVRPGMGL
jgi:hypothetical protein